MIELYLMAAGFFGIGHIISFIRTYFDKKDGNTARLVSIPFFTFLWPIMLFVNFMTVDDRQYKEASHALTRAHLWPFYLLYKIIQISVTYYRKRKIMNSDKDSVRLAKEISDLLESNGAIFPKGLIENVGIYTYQGVKFDDFESKIIEEGVIKGTERRKEIDSKEKEANRQAIARELRCSNF